MKRWFVAPVIACSSLVLSGCGGSPEPPPSAQATGSTLPSVGTPDPAPSSPATTPSPATAPVTGERARAALPQVTVDDVGARTKLDLASLSPSSQPLLVWLWAPH